MAKRVKAQPSARTAAGRAAIALDQRLGIAKAKHLIRKVFPDHWSFLLGEIALYSFVVLVITGVWLTMFFKPSESDTVYHGSYAPLDGLHMSEAYASTLKISFDIRAGLLIRQIHHWAALLFLAAICVHMLRIFFTGAFRKPREINWVIGVTLFILGLAEGFCGYSLPDDLLSGTGLRTFEGIVLSIPIIGTYLTFFFFGGQYPGTVFTHRLFTVHILLIPGLLVALISVHLLLIFYQKHTQYPAPGHRNMNVVGRPMIPVYAAKSFGLFMMLFGLLAGFGAFAQINPIWMYGPYEPQQATFGSQPDWYLGFLEGSMRLMPNWTTNFLGHTAVWNVFIPAVVNPLLLFAVLYAYPFLEQWVTGNRQEHHLLDRPRDQPTRTALGAAGATYFIVLTFAGADDIHTKIFRLAMFHLVWALRVAVFGLPLLVFFVTRRICMELQRSDWRGVLFGRDIGVVEQMPDGSYRGKLEQLDAGERYMLTSRDNGPANPPAPRDAKPRHWVLWSVRRALAQWDRNHRVRKPTAMEYNVAHRGLWGYRRQRPATRQRRRVLHGHGEEEEGEDREGEDPDGPSAFRFGGPEGDER